MSKTLNEILKKYVEDVHKIYGEKLRTVILYGSYARGDFRTDSDIDIMILVDLSDDEIRLKGHMLSNLTFDYNFYMQNAQEQRGKDRLAAIVHILAD